jgi:hypothetical protein
MSNATTLMIEVIVWMREGRIADSRRQDEEVEADGLREERKQRQNQDDLWQRYAVGKGCV